MMNQANIECPNCGTPIDVDDVLHARVKKEYDTKLEKERKSLQSKEDQLRLVQQNFVKEKEKFQEQVELKLKQRIQEEKLQLTKKIKLQLQEEGAAQMQSLQNELKDQTEKLKELNLAKAQVEQLKREKEAVRSEVELASQKKLTKQLVLEREKLAKQERERSELKLAESEKVIRDLTTQLKDAQRKAEQGSMQLQGEVQELAIEEYLRQEFPLDTIEEIKKGARGGDCIQVVNTRTNINCGTIYYESKRTQAWSPAWIEKFKTDMRERGVDLGVIVTEAMPKGMERLGLVDGIWVCSFQEFKGLCKVLRQQILGISQALSSQENKGDKMELLYNFLTSNEFKLQIEGIVDAFTNMQTELESEKRAFIKIWNKRQKHINRVTENTIAMYGSIQGIAGSAIQSIPALELDDSEDFDLLA